MGDVVDFKRPSKNVQKKERENKKEPGFRSLLTALNISKGGILAIVRILLTPIKNITGFLLKWMIILTAFLAIVEYAVDDFFLPPFYSALIFIGFLFLLYIICALATRKIDSIRNILN